MRRLRRKLDRRLAGGERLIGWKVGFGSSAGQQLLGLSHPLVGFLTDATELPNGGSADLSTWSNAVAEPEIAVYVGQEVPPSATDEGVRDAIEALGAAIELADVYPPPEEVEDVLAGNIFHRHVIFGLPDQGRAGGHLEGLRAAVNGEQTPRSFDLEENTGKLIDIVRTVAEAAPLLGHTLGLGNVIIAGSVLPPLAASIGEEIDFRLDPLEGVSVEFKGSPVA
ncbi:MAG: hypothetical protein ACE5MI_07200 [Acidimicrobiia bacterium]